MIFCYNVLMDNSEAPTNLNEEIQDVNTSSVDGNELITEPKVEAEPAMNTEAESVTRTDAESITKTENEPVAKTKKSKTSLIIAIVLLLLICGGLAALFLLNNQKKSDEQKNSSEQSKEQKATLSELSMNSNALSDFDLVFLKNNNTESNKVYSPLSIKYALRMLSDGSNGDTKTEIDTVIGDYQSKAYINSKNRSLANALFVRNSFKDSILDSYISGLKTNYGASVVYDDFTNATNINKWISDQTLGIVENMLSDEAVANIDYALVNALAIDMNWNNRIQCQGVYPSTVENKYYNVNYEHEKYEEYVNCVTAGFDFDVIKFNDNATDAKVARIGASINNYDIVSALGEEAIRSTVKTEYTKWLNSDEADRYAERDVDAYLDGYIEEIKSNYGRVDYSTDFKMYADDSVNVFVKDLATYDGGTLQYVSVMPKNQSLKDYIDSLSAESLSETINKSYAIEKANFKDGVITRVKGSIPFFNYSYDMDLVENLTAIGIEKVFNSDEADLSKMTNVENSAIASALHKADIEFTNEGIKAAAVSIEGGEGDAGPTFQYDFDVPVEDITLDFDKPYLYLVRDKDSGEVWFAGTVYEPTK